MICLKKFRPHLRFREGSQSSFSSLRALILCCFLLVLTTIVSLTSCSLFTNTEESTVSLDSSVISANEEMLDRQSLVRELAICISDTSKIESIYQLIPAAQLDGMSFASFSAYIQALSHIHADAGDITSFRFVSESERKMITDAIAADALDYQPLLQATIPVELFFTNTTSGSPPVYIYIQEDANGTPYLSSTWIRESLNVYDFAGLYFSALEGQNVEAVAALLEEGQVPTQGEFSPAVINYKASELARFYHIKVESKFAEYSLISIDISQLTYLQPEVLDDMSLGYHTRTVQFVRSALNRIAVRDSVINTISSKDYILYLNGDKTIRIGDQAYSNQFQDLFGEPALTTFGVQIIMNGGKGTEQQIIVLSYETVAITVNGAFYEGGSWDGQIISIELKAPDTRYYLGSTIRVGMTRDKLLMLYPFADQTGYVLTTTIDDSKYKMTFTFAEDKDRTVTDVMLEIVE